MRIDRARWQDIIVRKDTPDIRKRGCEVGSEKWLTCKEVAEHWQLSQNTVNRMIRRGELEAVRFGATWRIPAEAVRSYERRGVALNAS